MSTIQFTKMHGLGNDFVIINVHDLPIAPKDLPIAQLADRNRGIGFDQLLLITPKQKITEFFCQIYNADGSEAEQCGNGLRCIARYVQETGLCKENEISVSTITGAYHIKVEDYDHISVVMGSPQVEEPALDFECNNEQLRISILKLGNPHAIVQTQVADENAEAIAKSISGSRYFPSGANVGFVNIKDKHHLQLRTFERGAGKTLACGSNACAAAVAGILNGLVESPVRVQFEYGVVDVSWDGNQVELKGSATKVFEGKITL